MKQKTQNSELNEVLFTWSSSLSSKSLLRRCRNTALKNINQQKLYSIKQGTLMGLRTKIFYSEEHSITCNHAYCIHDTCSMECRCLEPWCPSISFLFQCLSILECIRRGSVYDIRRRELKIYISSWNFLGLRIFYWGHYNHYHSEIIKVKKTEQLLTHFFQSEQTTSKNHRFFHSNIFPFEFTFAILCTIFLGQNS